jgi:hypothetical protein
MRVLVSCEYSGRIRTAYRDHGIDAWSCDLLPCDDNSKFHIQGNVLDILKDGWDLMVAHPPCTHLAISGARWFKDKTVEQGEAIKFVLNLFYCPIPKVAIENPIGILGTCWLPPNQIVHPWMFGDFESKATCWWLKGLPPLKPVYLNPAECAKAKGFPEYLKPLTSVHDAGESPDRWKLRSKTFMGMAKAIATQWR